VLSVPRTVTNDPLSDSIAHSCEWLNSFIHKRKEHPTGNHNTFCEPICHLCGKDCSQAGLDGQAQ